MKSKKIESEREERKNEQLSITSIAEINIIFKNNYLNNYIQLNKVKMDLEKAAQRTSSLKTYSPKHKWSLRDKLLHEQGQTIRPRSKYKI